MAERVSNPAFAKAAQEAERMRQEEELAKNSSDFEFEKVEYMGLQRDVERVFRILGNPILSRETEEDPKLILQSEVVKDSKDGYIRINWPYIEKNGKHVPDPNWILTRMYNEVMTGKWEKLPEGKTNDWGNDSVKVYDNTSLDIFQRIDVNKKNNEKGFAKRFYPGKRILLNVIDRHDDWCKVNKHSKLLSSNVGQKEYEVNGKKEMRYFPQVGIPFSLYDNMFKHAIRFRGDWGIDMVVIKEEKTYTIRDAGESNYIVQEEAKSVLSIEELSSEEENYELYNIDKLFKVTSYQKLLKNLSGLFKLCDNNLNSSFYDELVKLAEKEKAEALANTKKVPDVKDEEGAKESLKEEVRETDGYEKAPLVSIFPKLDSLTDKDKDILSGAYLGAEGGVPNFTKESDPLTCANPDCTFPGTTNATIFPGNMDVCPVCGYAEPSDDPFKEDDIPF